MILDRYIGHGENLSDHLCPVCGDVDCLCAPEDQEAAESDQRGEGR